MNAESNSPMLGAVVGRVGGDHVGGVKADEEDGALFDHVIEGIEGWASEYRLWRGREGQ